MLAKLSLGINALLIIAVAFLFLRKPSSPEAEVVSQPKLPANSEFTKTDGQGPKAPIVAYINGATLNEKYDFILEKSKLLEQKYKASEEKIRKRYQVLEEDAQKIINYVNSGKATEQELAELELQLASYDREMTDLRRAEADKAMKKEAELQEELQARIQKFMEKYATSKGIDYVVNYQPSIQIILYGNEAYDITNEVVDGLNKEYQQEKAGDK